MKAFAIGLVLLLACTLSGYSLYRLTRLETALGDVIFLQQDPRIRLTLVSSEVELLGGQGGVVRWQGSGVLRLDPSFPVKNLRVAIDCELVIDDDDPVSFMIAEDIVGDSVAFSAERTVFTRFELPQKGVKVTAIKAKWWLNSEFPVELEVIKPSELLQ